MNDAFVRACVRYVFSNNPAISLSVFLSPTLDRAWIAFSRPTSLRHPALGNPLPSEFLNTHLGNKFQPSRISMNEGGLRETPPLRRGLSLFNLSALHYNLPPSKPKVDACERDWNDYRTRGMCFSTLRALNRNDKPEDAGVPVIFPKRQSTQMFFPNRTTCSHMT